MIRDELNRPAADLRISVTDRCNYRCGYCMPLGKYEWIDRREILTFEEITRLGAPSSPASGFARSGSPGGNRFSAGTWDRLVSRFRRWTAVQDLCLTTNGRCWPGAAPALGGGRRRVT